MGSGPLVGQPPLRAASGSRLCSTLADYPPTGVAFLVGAVSSWGGALPPFLWHLEWDTVDRRHEACQQIRIRTLGSFSSVPPGGETQGQSRERTCPRSHSKSGQDWEWNPTNPQSMALSPQSTADKQLTGTKEGNEGQVGAWRGAGQSQNEAGVQPVTNPVSSHRYIGLHFTVLLDPPSALQHRLGGNIKPFN